jgi:AcrR family transcriptional regulator
MQRQGVFYKMVQKAKTRPLGRPRQYDPQLALERAMEAFWDAGFSGTSLDDLTERMGMNRPSLYAAFGDKEALYLKTLESYRAGRRAALAAALSTDRPLREALRDLFEVMIERFTAGEHGARGCYLVGTAATEAVQNPKVRENLTESLGELDEVFRGAFSAAHARGELDEQADARELAMLASAVVHTLALRARSGQSRAVLRTVADSAEKLIFSTARRPRKSPRRR